MIEIGTDIESKARAREIQILVNIQEPDPEYQPFILTDEATVFEINLDSKDTIKKKYEFYFKSDLDIVFDQPLWKLVDQIKEKIKGWPDE